MRKPAPFVAALVLLAGGLWGMQTLQKPQPKFAPELTAPAAVTPSTESARSARAKDGLPPFLPVEARDTIARIQRGGPYLHHQDDAVFGNRERLLPQRPRGYYHEYTVETPGSRDRGARRIVTGGRPPEIWYYSDDHYQSFKSFSVPARSEANR